MCCFTREVAVSGTRIFARLEGGRQLLAYHMTYASDGDVAMVLPVPTPAGSSENAVRFLDLSSYPRFFWDLAASFEVTGAALSAPSAGNGASRGIEQLAVHDVGSFDASFVPSPREFLRLDPRFRLSPDVLAALPAYADWGFVVFKLKASKAGADSAYEHPMAFAFPTRNPGDLFFPCVHVHDGEVHATAAFDHQLYAQLEQGLAPRPGADRVWERSTGVLAEFADASRAQGLIDAPQLAFRVKLAGTFANEDVWIRGVPESEADATARTIARERAEKQRIERERYLAVTRRDEIVGRLVRGFSSLPFAGVLGFLVWISASNYRDGDPDGRPSAIVFAVAWLPAMWVLAHAVTGRARPAWITVGVSALLVAVALLAP